MSNNYFTKGKRIRAYITRHIPHIAVFSLILGSSMIFFNNYTLAISIELDDMPVAQVDSQEVLDTALETAQTEISNILGYDYDLANRISTKTTIVKRSDTSSDYQAVVEDIYNNVDGIDVQYALLVDGEELGCVSDLEQADELISSQLDSYSSDITLSAEYAADIELDPKYASVEQSMNDEEVASVLACIPVEAMEGTTIQTPYEIMYICSDTLAPGEFEVSQSGVAGEAIATELVTYIDGLEQQREMINKIVVSEPVAEIITVSSSQPGSSTGSFIWPADGTVSSGFGSRAVSVGSSDHKGIDICCPSGDPIYAADGGEVIFAGTMSGYGNLVQIQHEDGSVTYYGHCSSIDVAEGDLVSQGEQIACVGMTGTASGYHLHFEVRIDGEPVDPLTYLPQ